MKLLVCVLSDPDPLDDILQAFIEIGIGGATIIDTYGMGQALIQDIPIFAGFRSLLAGSGTYNKTFFSVIRDEEKLEQAIAAIQDICGGLEDPHKGIVFTVPVDRAIGLVPEGD